MGGGGVGGEERRKKKRRKKEKRKKKEEEINLVEKYQQNPQPSQVTGWILTSCNVPRHGSDMLYATHRYMGAYGVHDLYRKTVSLKLGWNCNQRYGIHCAHIIQS